MRGASMRIDLRGKKQALPEQLPAVPTYGTVYARFTLPKEAADTATEALTLQAEALSPFEEGSYAVGMEALGSRGSEEVYLVAVASEVSLDDPWHGWLAARGALGKLRLDLSALGWLRGMKERHPALAKGRWLAALRTGTEQLIFLLEDGCLSEVRALPPEAADADFQREATLALAQGAMAGFGMPEGAVIFAGEPSAGVPLRELLGQEPAFEPLGDGEAEAFLQRGLRLRAEEGATFDLTPQAWRDEAHAAHQRRFLSLAASVLGVLWLIGAATLFLLPKIYAHRAKVAQSRLDAQRAVYEEVLDLRERVSLIERYQDRSFSALEMLRLVCEAKAEGMIFLSMTYRQKQTLRLTGTTDATADVYTFKDTLQKDTRIREVRINRLVQDGKTQKQRFDVEILFAVEEESA